MNVAATYLSLFSGAAGLDLGLHIAIPSVRCVSYCEREESVCRVLAARMEEGSIDAAPIFTDVRTFPSRLFSGRVDGIIGGFPCQDMSVAGRGAGILAGERSSLWFDFLRIITEVSPSWVFIENVPGIFNSPGGDLESEDTPDGESTGWTVRNIDAVLGPLSEIGFDVEWLTLRASDVGAAHQRNRFFALAYRPGSRFGWREDAGTSSSDAGANRSGRVESSGIGMFLEHAERPERRPGVECGGYGEPGIDGQGEAASGAGDGIAVLGDAIGAGLEERGCLTGHLGQECTPAERTGDELADSTNDLRRAHGGCAGQSEDRSSRKTQRGAIQRRVRGSVDREGSECGCPELFFNIPGPGLGAAGVIDDIRELYRRSPSRAWDRYQAELRNTFAWSELLVLYPWMRPAVSQAEVEPDLCDCPDWVADMVAHHRTTALRSVGNGVHSLQSAAALTELFRRIG